MEISFTYFLKLFEKGCNIDETVFFFTDDDKETEHYLGYLPDGPTPEKPYWAGYCDHPEGFVCATAEELLNAPIFGGKSIHERWDNVKICSIGGVPADEYTGFTGMKLSGYLGKEINIVNSEGIDFHGIVTDYFFPDENESGEESIIIDSDDGRQIEFYCKEIKNIECAGETRYLKLTDDDHKGEIVKQVGENFYGYIEGKWVKRGISAGYFIPEAPEFDAYEVITEAEAMALLGM